MIDVAGTVLIAVSLLVHIQALFFLTQVLASLPAERAAGPVPSRRRASRCVIIPAHNESALIEKTVGAIKGQLATDDRLIVVADNCADDTANLATRAGAEVVERHDLQRIGKGYALDRGIRFVEQTGKREVLIFVDADCELAPGSIDELSRHCVSYNRPVQASNLTVGSHLEGRIARIALFAWKVKNYVRPLGALRLGLPCPLTGTGMALPWSLACAVDVSTGHIAEDAKLGIDLAIDGHAPLFCPAAVVTSRFAVSTEGIRAQRTRWEHGHLAMIGEYVPRLLWNAYKKRRMTLLAMALDLSIPPLGLFFLLMIGLMAGAVLVTLSGFRAPCVLVAGSTLATFGLAIVLAWYRHGSTTVSARDLLLAPLYALTKISTFWRFVRKRQVIWVRAERDLR